MFRFYDNFEFLWKSSVSDWSFGLSSHQHCFSEACQDVSKQLHGVYDVWVLPILPVHRDELLPRQDCFHQQQDEDRPQLKLAFPSMIGCFGV